MAKIDVNVLYQKNHYRTYMGILTNSTIAAMHTIHVTALEVSGSICKLVP